VSVTRPATETLRRLPVRRMLVVTPFVAIAMGAAVMGHHVQEPDNRIVAGVHVGDLDLSGKSLDEAKSVLEQWASAKQATRVPLRFAPESDVSRTWNPDAAKLGLSVNVESTLEAASKVGHDNFIGQVSHIFSGAKAIQVAPVPATDDARLNAYVKRQIAASVNRKPKNAQFVLLKGGGFGTHHELNGLLVDIDSSTTAIKQAWTAYLATGTAGAMASPNHAAQDSSGDTPAADASGSTGTRQAAPTETSSVEAVLSAKVAPAAITTADINQIDTVLGAKSSYVNGTPSRLGNIRIAAGRINGTLLKAGDIFSYNEIVGPRDEDSGYREAPILVRGRHDKGIAGGICQTSGTLFNAVLKSGLKIVEREHHSTPIGYLPIGLDATVSYGSLDFKFKNDTEAPVYVAARLNGRELTFTLFGKETPGREVALVRGAYSRTGPSYETQTDNNKPAGYRHTVEVGSGGCRVTWYRVIKENGKVVHRDVISSHYSPHPGVVVVGAGAAKPRAVRRTPTNATSAPAVSPGSGSPAPPDGVP
jgi:vancomycin resistance protein YoaR